MLRTAIFTLAIFLSLWQTHALAKTGEMTMFDFKNQKPEFWKEHLEPEIYRKFALIFNKKSSIPIVYKL